jgi:hypothetical protein
MIIVNVIVLMMLMVMTTMIMIITGNFILIQIIIIICLITIIVMMIVICRGYVDGCRKCNGDRFGEGCCDSYDGVDCKCDGDVDDDGDGDVAGCGHDDRCGFMMNEFFRRDDIDLIPTIAMRDVFDADDESFMFFCHLDADDFVDAYACIPVCLH